MNTGSIRYGIGGVCMSLETIIHGNEQLPVAIYNVSKSHSRYIMASHWHPEHEILYIQHGCMNLRLNNTTYELHTGDVVFYPGGTIHTGEPDDCLYSCILLNLPSLIKKSDGCIDFVNKLQSGEIEIIPLLGRRSEEFRALCEKMLEIDQYRRGGYMFDIKSLIFRFFGIIMNEELFIQTTPDTLSAQANIGKIKRLMRYIEDNFEKPIQLSEMASFVDMNPSYLCRSFRAVTGNTPVAFLIEHRLAKARYSLMTSNISITDIALSCGFNDASYFTRAFRQRYGVSPIQFREQNITSDT